jgi:cobalt/nickel transport system permease protein
VTKLSVVLLYTLLLVSFGKYEVVSILPFIFFPVYLAAVGGVSPKPLLKRLVWVEPMIITVGLLNPLFDHSTIFAWGHEISAGWLTSASIILKGTLAVTAALLLIATTGMEGVSLSMRKLGVPKIFVLQMTMTYRYLSVLLEETARTIQAHSLRALGHNGLGRQTWGPLLGQILLRTVDRAQRVYNAMLLRGFTGEYRTGGTAVFGKSDALFILLWSAFFIVSRRFNIPFWLGSIMTGAK